jgi:hypothetical protein
MLAQHTYGEKCVCGGVVGVVGVVGAAQVCCGIRYGADFHHNGTEVDCNKQVCLGYSFPCLGEGGISSELVLVP